MQPIMQPIVQSMMQQVLVHQGHDILQRLRAPPPQPARPQDDARERLRHQSAIAALAEQLARPLQEVQPLYDDILEQMRPQAVIPDYLPIFVAKRVRRLLQN